jgi:peptidoglycan/LPS O-acetylase OafA/YrhL
MSLKVRSFIALDGLRCVAALTVLIMHAERFFPVWPKLGWLSVDCFFALSGFVLAHAYDTKLRDGLGPNTFLKL